MHRRIQRSSLRLWIQVDTIRSLSPCSGGGSACSPAGRLMSWGCTSAMWGALGLQMACVTWPPHERPGPGFPAEHCPVERWSRLFLKKSSFCSLIPPFQGTPCENTFLSLPFLCLFVISILCPCLRSISPHLAGSFASIFKAVVYCQHARSGL